MKRFGGTFSGKKIALGVPEITIVGYTCSIEGRAVSKSAIAKVEKWQCCKDVGEVRRFLGLLGVGRIWIKNFGEIVRPMVQLTRKENEFEWTEVHQESMDRAKKAFLDCGVIKPLDYGRIDTHPPILAIDASQTGCGVEIAQMDEQGRRRPARFMSIYYNEVQQRYSQPKLELYGIYVGMRAARQWLYGCKFILETDCSSIKGMINAPSYPSAAETRWCWYILTNHFEIKHVAGEKHKVADALSRRRAEPDDSDEEDPEEWLDKYCGEKFAGEAFVDDDREALEAWDGQDLSAGYDSA
jgi:hypothetical protein